jgi:hypothetical protein
MFKPHSNRSVIAFGLIAFITLNGFLYAEQGLTSDQNTDKKGNKINEHIKKIGYLCQKNSASSKSSASYIGTDTSFHINMKTDTTHPSSKFFTPQAYEKGVLTIAYCDAKKMKTCPDSLLTENQAQNTLTFNDHISFYQKKLKALKSYQITDLQKEIKLYTKTNDANRDHFLIYQTFFYDDVFNKAFCLSFPNHFEGQVRITDHIGKNSEVFTVDTKLQSNIKVYPIGPGQLMHVK